MRFARVEKVFTRDEEGASSSIDAVVEIIVEREGFTIHDMFHPDFVAGLHEINDAVEVGWVLEDGEFKSNE
jgi:hypothetical protein